MNLGSNLASHLIVRGGRPLSGEITPSGNKNAVLPILCATLLTTEPVTIENVPDITDVRKIVSYFSEIGSHVEWNRETRVLVVEHAELGKATGAYGLPRKMRSSVMLLGPLLHRVGSALVREQAKGCTLGVREIDPHLEILRGFGATLDWGDTLTLRLDGRPVGFHHWQDYASVTATEHFAMVAAVAKGESVLTNAACEPHVQDLCHMLVAMGAKVEGIGSSTLRITGVDQLGGCRVRVSDDHHEVLTFLAIGAMTGGNVRVNHTIQHHFPLMDRVLARMGVQVVHGEGYSEVVSGGPLRVQTPLTKHLTAKVEAAPWPYYPVDLLPPIVALACKAEGEVLFWNKIYEGAFQWIPELQKFGAKAVVCDPHRVMIFGGGPLRPATVEAPYIIRVIIALFMVASSIEGESVIRNAGPVRRAHPRFVENLRSLGADVHWAT